MEVPPRFELGSQDSESAKCCKQGGNNQCELDIIARVAAVQAENQ